MKFELETRSLSFNGHTKVGEPPKSVQCRFSMGKQVMPIIHSPVSGSTYYSAGFLRLDFTFVSTKENSLIKTQTIENIQ